MSGSLETSDLLVVVDKGDVYTVNVDAPSIIQISSNDTYYRVADYAYTASYSVTSSFALNVPPLPDGIVSSSSQINSGSFSGSFIGDGSQLTGIATDLSFTGDIGSSSINLKTTALDIIGSNGIQTIVSGNTIELIAPIGTVSSSTQIDYQQIQNQPSVIPTASYVEYTGIVNVPTLVSSSVQINTGSFSGSFIGDGSQLTGLVTDLRISGSTGSDTISLLSDTLQVLGTNGVSTTVTNNSIAITIPIGSVSSSTQIDYQQIQNQPTVIPTASYVEYTNVVNTPTLVSASSQIELSNISGNTFASSSYTFPQRVTVVGATTLNNVLYTYGANTDVDTGTEVIAVVSSSIYDGVFFDYIVKKSTNYRIGTVMAIWSGSTVEYTDFSTNDLGDTSQIEFSVDILANQARLLATTTSNDWIVKTSVRAL